MKRKLNRITPALGPELMKTFQVKAPVDTHWRRGTCEEVQCTQHERGWKMQLDLSTQLGQQQAAYLKHKSGRYFTWEKLADNMVELTFPSGQTCFREHKVRLDREEVFVVKGGDFRGNPRGTASKVFTKPEHWVEEFALHQESIRATQQKG